MEDIKMTLKPTLRKRHPKIYIKLKFLDVLLASYWLILTVWRRVTDWSVLIAATCVWKTEVPSYLCLIFSEDFELHALQTWPAEPNWYKLRSASAVFNSSVRYGAAAHAFGMGLNEFNQGRKQPGPEPITYPQSALHSKRSHTKSLVRILTTCKLELEQTNQLQGFYFLLACARPGCGKKNTFVGERFKPLLRRLTHSLSSSADHS